MEKANISSGPIGVKSIDTIETPRPEPFWPEIPAIYVYRWLSSVTIDTALKWKKEKEAVVVAAAEWTFTLQIYTSAHFQTVVRWARHWSFLFIVTRLALALSLSLYLSMNIEPLSLLALHRSQHKNVYIEKQWPVSRFIERPFHLLLCPFFFVCVHYIQWSRVKVKTYTYDPPPLLYFIRHYMSELWFQYQTVFPFSALLSTLHIIIICCTTFLLHK